MTSTAPDDSTRSAGAPAVPTTTERPPPPLLDAAQVRVLGVLVEKESTVPDTYPMSLNALVAGCNQKTAREPVLALTESQVVEALDALKSRTLVLESSGSRVARWEHNVPRALRAPKAGVALLAMLMLRGPQTAAELRLHTERLHRFADVSSVEAFLDELAGRGLVARLARAPGTRESRWAHGLAGARADAAGADDVDEAAAMPASASTQAGAHRVDAGEVAALRADVRRLDAEVAALRREMALLTEIVGAATAPPTEIEGAATASPADIEGAASAAPRA